MGGVGDYRWTEEGEGGGGGADTRKCFCCQKVGHLANKCPDKKDAADALFVGWVDVDSFVGCVDADAPDNEEDRKQSPEEWNKVEMAEVVNKLARVAERSIQSSEDPEELIDEDEEKDEEERRGGRGRRRKRSRRGKRGEGRHKGGGNGGGGDGEGRRAEGEGGGRWNRWRVSF